MEIAIIIAALVGAGAGVAGGQVMVKKKHGEAEKNANKALEKAKKEAEEVLSKAKAVAQKSVDEAREEEKSLRRELAETERRIVKREESLDAKLDTIDQRKEKLDKDEKEIEELKDAIGEIRKKQLANLEKIAGLSKADAKEKLIKATEKDVKNDLVGLVAKLQTEAKDNAEDNAKMILLESMERLASDVTTERTVTSLPMPEDMKGRIIGKEGRNIQAIQKLTGVDVLVDEAPGMVVLSCFDPVRRQVARVVLEKLMKDGRVHPGRIEEVVEKAQNEIDKELDKAAEEAMREVGVPNLPKEMKQLLGELKFRTSYGQNVLKHSTEMAHLAGMLASELGLDVQITKTAALLHDIGKAVTHKIEGKHHHIGAELAEKAGMKPEIVHAINAHHDDVEATTPEAMVIRVVDAVSAARPGARSASAEDFVKRMQDLENVANAFPGIEKTYAISAGREIRVFVRPESIDDLASIQLARDIANKIEATMSYPGTIKVNIIRETRAIEYAK
jgi:ribonuclease Y